MDSRGRAAITVEESVVVDELSAEDLRVIERSGGARFLGPRVHDVVLVGRLQRALLEHAPALAAEARLAADGKMGSRTRLVLNGYAAEHPENPFEFGPELERITAAPAIPEPPPTGDLPEDPHEEVTADHRPTPQRTQAVPHHSDREPDL